MAARDRRERIVAQLTKNAHEGPLPARICTVCVELVGVTGAGLTVISTSGQRSLVHATDAVAAELEDLQLTVGEGPCVAAFNGRGPVLISALAADFERWPAFSPLAEAAGVAAVFSFPLQLGASRLGVLDLYRTRAGPLSPAQLTDALILSDLATEALFTGGNGDMLQGTDSHPEVHQATGMVMVQLSVSAGEALLRLRGYAYAHNVMIAQVARDVISRNLRFEGDEP